MVWTATPSSSDAFFSVTTSPIFFSLAFIVSIFTSALTQYNHMENENKFPWWVENSLFVVDGSFFVD
jgi:hypothetical protein